MTAAEEQKKTSVPISAKSKRISKTATTNPSNTPSTNNNLAAGAPQQSFAPPKTDGAGGDSEDSANVSEM